MKPHGNLHDLSGQTFGSLTVIERDVTKTARVHWVCRCSCGRTSSPAACNLKAGLSVTCGRCVGWKENRSEHRVWSSMLSRCLNPTHHAFQHYGGRGITVCDRWRSFRAFFADMGKCPKGWSLDRINNDGGYSPENCRWASWIEQANNKRSNRNVTINGQTRTLKQWTRALGLNYQTVKTRLNVLGWDYERALKP